MAFHLRAMLFSLARTRLGGWMIREVFTRMSFAIPFHHLRETDTLLAFPHPSPSYQVHILIIPRKSYRSLSDVPPEDGAFLRDLLSTVQSLVKELRLDETGYRLIANGGAYQEVPLLHFHLISEDRQ